MIVKVSAFARSFDREGFTCGVGELDAYLKRQASQDIKRNLAACFILHEEGSQAIEGFYTLSAFSVELGDLPEAVSKKLPNYPEIPAMLLGRLAISKNAQGKGYGELLLMNALERVWGHSKTLGCWAVVVDAINEDAVRFYEHFDFRQDAMPENRLFLTTKEIGKLFA